MEIPDHPHAQQYFISPEGLQQLLKRPKDQQYPNRHVLWTDDATVELPIRMGTSGITSLTPTTLIHEFRTAVKEFGLRSALSSKINGIWFTYNYKQYYQQCTKFAKSLLAYQLSQHSSINIIGFNSPEWFFAFFGSIMSRCIPVGVYTTNNQTTCSYIAQHSQAELVLAQNREHASKYLDLLRKGTIKLIVLYNDKDYKVEGLEGKIITYRQFIKEGERIDEKEVEKRIEKLQPGQCCTIVYTSGTTGMPKGVMLSHDNYTWSKKSLDTFHDRDKSKPHRAVTYLPLSHVAAQYSDIVGPMMEGVHVFFADPSALQGTLIQTLQEVKPTYFFSVPRVWEKIYDKMMEIARSNGWLKSKIATWAKSLGPEGTDKERRKEEPSIQFKLAKILVFNNVKKALGLDQCEFFFFGAAPLDPTIRRYFLSLNFYLINSYGMSESTGPQNLTDNDSLDVNGSLDSFREVGRSLPGTEIKIMKQSPNDPDGQICYRGRNTFMGYYKNPEETAKTIDSTGFLHSGDNGTLTDKGVLFITGRAKELIITAGGQNIPPLLIENEIRAALPFIANVMLVGDMRKYLTCLLTLKEDQPGSGKLDNLTKAYFSDRGCQVSTIEQALRSDKVRKILEEGLRKANEKAISRAQYVQNFTILPEDFSVENGTLTATLKLKRKEVLKKYAGIIETMYTKPSL